MLKRVSTSDIELGMFIHKLEGNWFRHPFWKRRFLLDDPDMRDVLRESDVAGVVIDTAKGRDVAAPPPAPRIVSGPRNAGAPLVPRPGASSFGAGFHRPQALPVAREFGRARRVAGEALRVVSRTFLEARLGKAICAQDVEPVIDTIYASVQRNLYAFNGLLRCRQDSESVYRHSLAVSALMIAMARQMKLSPLDMREAGMAGLLMDIGVGQLPVDLAALGGDYSALRPELREQHVVLGYSFLKAAGDIPDQVLRVCLRHHERLDGSGYPQKLEAPDLDLLSRMAAICDAFDSLVSTGDPAQRLDPAVALRALRDQPQAFDADVLERFVETVGIYPIGAFVELRSGRLAMVIDEDPSDPALPTVRTLWSLPQARRIKSETIALAHCYGADEITGVADLEGLALPEVGKLREVLLAGACKEANA